MRRLALPVAALIACTGLAVAVNQAGTANADIYKGYQGPDTADCLATNPFPTSMTLKSRGAFFYAEREQDGTVQYYRGVARSAGIGGVNIPTSPGGGQLLGQTAADLTGQGAQEVVRANGMSGGEPLLTVDSYQPGNPATSPLDETLATKLPKADSIAIAAANFHESTPSDWQSNPQQVADPDEVAVAWRTPGDDGQAVTINVQMYRPISNGTGGIALTSYGEPLSIYGTYDREGGSREAMLAMTTGDLDHDGRPELVLTYSWGTDRPTQFVAVLEVGDAYAVSTAPEVVGVGSYPVAGSTLRQLTVNVGHFGPSVDDIVLGSVVDAGGDHDDNPPQNAFMRVVGLPAGQLGTAAKPVTLTGGDIRKFATPATNHNATTISIAVGDLDLPKPSNGDLANSDSGIDEVLIGYADRNLDPDPDDYRFPYGYAHFSLGVYKVDPNTHLFENVRTYRTTSSLGHHYARSVSIGIGDTDGDGDGDIVQVYTTGEGTHVASLLSPAPGGIELVKRWTLPLYSDNGEPAPILMADVGNESTRMVQRRGADYPFTGVSCRDLEAKDILDVADPAPSWQTGAQEGYLGSTFIGRTASSSVDTSKTTSTTIGRSYTTTGGVDFDAKLFEAEATVQYEHGWETSSSSAVTHTQGFDLSEGLSNTGGVSSASVASVTYRCYYYDLMRGSGTTPFGQSRACIPINPGTRDLPNPDTSPDFYTYKRSVSPYDLDKWQQKNSDQYYWTPFQDEWTNLGLTVPASSTTISGVAGVAGRAIDSNKSPDAAGTVATSARQANPWWQITLNQPADISGVRVFPGRLDLCQDTSPCEDALHDFDVYVFNNPNFAAYDMARLQTAAANAASGVRSFHFSGPVGDVANVVTDLGDGTGPAAGKYVRVQATGPATYLQLAEVQVFPSMETLSPTDYPATVRPATAQETAGLSDKNVFVAKVWNPSSRTYTDRLMSGRVYSLDPDPGLQSVDDTACSSTIPMEWTKSSSNGTETSHSTSTSQGIGVSADVTVGAEILKVKQGGGYTDTTSTEHSDASGISIGNSFSISWDRSPMCARDANGNPLKGYSISDSCNYEFKPFYYVSTETSNTGFEQQFTHVSYIVQFPNGRGADLTDCLQNHWHSTTNRPPTASDATVWTSGPATITTSTLAAADRDPSDVDRLAIMGVDANGDSADLATVKTPAGGTATVVDGKVVYTPPTVGWSQDTFYATVTDHYYDHDDGASASPPVKITVYNSVAYPAQVTNPGFDSGLSGWKSAGIPAWTAGGTDGAPTSGPFASDTIPAGGGAATLTQTFTVPTTGKGLLTVYRRVTPQGAPSACAGAPPMPIDALTATVTPAGGAAKSIDNATTRDAGLCTWRKAQYDLSAYKGQFVTLIFTAGGGPDGYPTKFDIDGLSLS
jgi:hypothetical protein